MFSPLAVLALAAALLAAGPSEPSAAAPASPAVAAAAPVYTHAGATPPPHGYPEIREVKISATDIRAGQRVTGSVETSDNVSYVEARIDYRNAPMHKDGAGRFSLQYTVPWWLPPWLRRPYTLQIIARSVDGVETMHPIPIRIH